MKSLTFPSGTHVGALLSLAAVVACDGPTPPRSDFTIDMPATATLLQGEMKTLPITIQRNNFDNYIRLSLSGTIPGITAQLIHDTLPAPMRETGVAFSVHRSAGPATGTLTLTATSVGAAPRTATMSVTVNVRGSFSIAAEEPVSLAAQGGAAAVPIRVDRVDGNGSVVSLTATGLPPGVTVKSSTTEFGGATVWLAAAPNTALGRHQVNVTGTADGLPLQFTTVALDVVAPPSTSSVSFSLCGVPAWGVYRNEGYGWRPMSLNDKTFTVDATERLTVAYAFLGGGGSTVWVLQLSRAELSQWSATCGAAGTKTIAGTFADLPAERYGRVWMGRTWIQRSGTAPSFAISGLPEGALDVLAARGDFTTPDFTPDLFVARPSVEVPSGGSLPPIEFASEGVAPKLAMVTISLLSTADDPLMQVRYSTPASPGGFVVHSRSLTSNDPVEARFIPASLLQPDDVQAIRVEGGSFSFSPFRLRGRGVQRFLREGADQSIAMPSLVSVAGFEMLGSESWPRLRALVPTGGTYGSVGMMVFISNDGQRDVGVVQTSGYLGSAPATWSLTVPDFAGVDGFSQGWLVAETANYQLNVASGPPEVMFLGARGRAGEEQQYSWDVNLPSVYFARTADIKALVAAASEQAQSRLVSRRRTGLR